MSSACWVWALLAVATVAVFGSGCGVDERLVEQRERFALEERARIEALERVEARMVDAAARSRGWRELGQRRAEVTEIACENAALHASAIERHFSRQEERARLMRYAARQMAEARVPQEGPAQDGKRNKRPAASN